MTETAQLPETGTAERDRQHRIWRQVEVVRRLSDRVIGVGPFGIGLDGLLTWIPLVGGAYSISAGGYLIVQAVRSRARATTIARMMVWLVADTVTTEVPIIGDAIDFFLTSHQMAAKALQADIEARHGPPPDIAATRARKVG